MIERQILAQKLKEKQIEDYVFSYLGRLSCSHVKMQRTPLGEKIIVHTSRPGLIVGKKGANIKAMTYYLKTKFGMENPQIEVEEISNPALDAASVARTLISGFQRFGPKRFKAMAYKALEETLKAGASGIEVVISGRGVPGERAKSWRFAAGYLKKSGDISASFMDRCYENCDLKSGTIGIKVSILHSDIVLPDKMRLKTKEQQDKAENEHAVKAKSETKKEEKIEAKESKKEKPKKTERVFEAQKSEAFSGKPRKPRVKKEEKTEKKTEEKVDNKNEAKPAENIEAEEETKKE